VEEDSINDRWKWFKNCLGALDETHIKVHVPVIDKPKYRTRNRTQQRMCSERLSSTKNMCIQEMVAMFLYICAHDVKNRVIKRQVIRSSEKIRQFGRVVLNSVLRLQDYLLKKA